MASIAAKKRPKDAATSADQMSKGILLYSILLALQYGAQPLISKRCTRREVIVTSSVLTCEIVKVVCALVIMAKEGSLKKTFSQWTVAGALTASGLPAIIYALQNSLLQIAYKNLDSLTFSMLNQTKILFTAVCTYLLLRQRQSIQQIGALFLLIVAAVLLSIGEGSSKGSSDGSSDQILFHGIIPVLVASVLSGMASALCQWSSQIPVLFNALGGILVGLVTSRAGGVRKASFELVYLTPQIVLERIRHCVGTSCDSIAAVHIRRETTFSVLHCGSSPRGQ
ncbi:CMP-sialic acid transporter 5 [Cucurbita argyrosperma subsp. argyrosperma]|nr:CMP-sialic acid transporter 5 [Cucurbita argyrosperma subsp. argyrosperma]